MQKEGVNSFVEGVNSFVNVSELENATVLMLHEQLVGLKPSCRTAVSRMIVLSSLGLSRLFQNIEIFTMRHAHAEHDMMHVSSGTRAWAR